MTGRLILAFILTFAALQFKAEAQSEAWQSEGRYEISTSGVVFWLPGWIPSDIYSEFKNELIALQANKPKLSETQSQQCQASYQKLFHKSDIRWSVYFGYGDGNNDNIVTDFAERELFEKEVNKPCSLLQPEIQFCGFEIVNKQEGQYKKQIRTKQNQLVTIHLRLLNPSISSNEKDNLKNSQQRKKSKSIEKSFLKAMHTDDIVFYSGHARYGAGPGFRPMVAKSKDWWIATLFRPMMTNLNHTMKPATHPDEIVFEPQKPLPKVMGLFSCEAEGHYGLQFANNAPDSGLIMTRQTITTLDNMRLLYAAANSLITETCEEQFQENMAQAIRTVFYDPKKGKPKNFKKYLPKFFNFFHKDRIKNQNDLLMYLRTRDDESMDIGEF